MDLVTQVLIASVSMIIVIIVLVHGIIGLTIL